MKTAEFNNNYKTNLITLGSLLGVTLLSGVVLTSSITKADNDSVVDDVSISVPTSCTMSSSGTNSHTAEINNGQYNSAVGETTIKAFCNDNAGFAIYAIGFTGNTLGSNVLANESLPSSNIATGTATSGQTSNWAMKLSTITSPAPTYPIIISGSESDTQKETGDPDYSSFQQVPDDYTKVAYRTAGTDTGVDAEGSTVKTTYQVYISPNQPAGTYNGKVKYVMIHPSTADAPTIPTGVTCNPSGTTIGTGNSTDLVCMQDFASLSSASRTSVLNSMTTDAQYQLYDSRDDKQYYIAKLQDGNVWMTQNLDHDIDTAYNYTNENTDIGYNTSTNTYDTASWTPDRSTYATNEKKWNGQIYDETSDNWIIDSTTGVNGYYYPESYDPGDVYWNGNTRPTTWDSCEAAGGEWWDSSDYCAGLPSPISSTGDRHYHLGNYYNWAASLATNDVSTYSGEARLIERSICPAGWTLPRGRGADDSFTALWNQYGFQSSFIDEDDDYEWDSNELALWTSPFYIVPNGYGIDYDYGVGLRGQYSTSIGHSGLSGQYSAGNTAFEVNGYIDDSGDTSAQERAVRCVTRPVSSTFSH